MRIKGWSRRYEIIYGDVTLNANTEAAYTAKRWRVIHYLEGGGAGLISDMSEKVSGAPVDIDDGALLVRSGIGEVTVPIVIVREGKRSAPIMPVRTK